MPTTPDLIPAIRRAGELLASAHEGLGHLLCSEIQGVIDLLLAAGLRGTTIDVITSHARGDDDEDDVHHHIYLAITDNVGDPSELAAQLVDAQLRGEPLLKWRNLLPKGGGNHLPDQERPRQPGAPSGEGMERRDPYRGMGQLAPAGRAEPRLGGRRRGLADSLSANETDSPLAASDAHVA